LILLLVRLVVWLVVLLVEWLGRLELVVQLG
jgi:hypothetical protein